MDYGLFGKQETITGHNCAHFQSLFVEVVDTTVVLMLCINSRGGRVRREGSSEDAAGVEDSGILTALSLTPHINAPAALTGWVTAGCIPCCVYGYQHHAGVDAEEDD